MSEKVDPIQQIASTMARSSIEEKEAFLLKEFKARPDLLSRLEDIVIEETPIRFDTAFGDGFDIDSNEYKFVITYNWRIRMITDHERVLRYINQERVKLEALGHPDPSPEAKDNQIAHLAEKAWGFIRDGVKL